jgi:hypothetical protein
MAYTSRSNKYFVTCVIYDLNQRVEYRLTVAENSVLKRIFGHKREEVTVGWGKLHNEKLENMYSSDIIEVIKLRRKKWVSHVECIGETRNACRI